ncbi:MAG: hypothetical protein GX937_08300 [Lentisphaerae bacterium]|jgi:hypothetical protein|nr:hypothetical protein [Lentisphaerota bacterium]
MKKVFLSALATVSRIRFDQGETADARAHDVEAPGAAWFVLARALLAVAATAAAAIVLWMVTDQLIAALLATAAFIAVRCALAADYEREGAVAIMQKLRPGNTLSETELYYRNAIFNLLLLLRPLAIFCLCLRYSCLWLVPCAALATAVMTELTEEDGDSRTALPRHWLMAAAIVLVTTGLGSRLSPERDGMFILGILATVFAWLLPAMITKFWPPREFANLDQARAVYLYLGEIAILCVGLLGLAL